MIKYIGSKRVLVPKIVAACQALESSGSVLDLFSGTSRVGHALKKQGYYVIANDHNRFAYTLAKCYVATDRDAVIDEVRSIIRELNQLPPNPGYFTRVFCEEAWYFHPKNGARVDAIRERISELSVSPKVEAVLLTSLMEAADRVDSTVGVQMAYLKSWAKRAHNDLHLRVPDLVPGDGRALCEEAVDAASQVEADICYLDPPYNQHSYRGNYHIWETLVRWDKPEYYGKANKRIDCREYSSDFNSKPRIRDAVKKVLDAVNAKHLVLSFSNEGYLDREELEGLLEGRGVLSVFAFDHKRYVGAQIGIHDLEGQKVGKVSHLDNVEHLYVVSRDREAAKRVNDALREGEYAQEELFG